MNILLIASEAAPYYKTGGLADVVDGFSRELNSQLHDARVVVPRYRTPNVQPPALETVVGDLRVQLGSAPAQPASAGTYARTARVLAMRDHTTTYFIEQDFYFGRDQLYGYPDDYERFIFFGLAALQMLADRAFTDSEKSWFPEIIQCFDWATGLVPMWVHKLADVDTRFRRTRSVLTIYNPRRLGRFGSRSLQLAGLASEGIYPEAGERDETVSFLGRGVLFADRLVTVDPLFDPPAGASDQRSSPGLGAEGTHNPLPEPAQVLKEILDRRRRNGTLVGIRNGIDEDSFDPRQEDPRVPASFTPTSLRTRAKNKLALQEMLGLPTADDIPLLGMVSRLMPGNGFEMLRVLRDGAGQEGDRLQLAVLADTGPAELRDVLLGWEAEQDPGDPWIKSRFQYDDSLARLIYAACDIYLIPAKEYPNGISQYIAMRYGAIPLVFHTGALCHSVRQYSADHTPQSGPGYGVGFKFYEYDEKSFLDAVGQSVDAFRQPDRTAWRQLQLANMRGAYDWGRPAVEYIALYTAALSDDPMSVEPGRPLRLDRDARLLQAVLEVDNLPGLGTRQPREVLRQAGRIIRGVLECDAVYVWDMQSSVGGEIVEPSVDLSARGSAPDQGQVTRLLSGRTSSAWGSLGDTDLDGICQPIFGLEKSSLARAEGWIDGRSVPITAHGNVLGRVDVFLTQRVQLKNDRWLSMALTTLAGSIGQRLYSIREAEELDQVSLMGEQLLCAHSFEDAASLVVDWAVKLTPAEHACLYFSDEAGQQLVPLGASAREPEARKMAEQILRTGETISLVDWVMAPRRPDGHRLYRSLLAVPLFGRGAIPRRAVGALVLLHENPAAFSNDCEQLVERHLAPHAASALRTNGWLRKRDHDRVQQLENLSESLVSGGGFAGLLQGIVTTTMNALSAEAGSLYLLDDETDRLVIRAAAGYHSDLLLADEKPSYALGEGTTGWIAETGEIFRADSIEELHSDRWRGKYKHLQNGREPNAFLGIPLRLENRTIGVLKLEDRTSPPPLDKFSDEDVLLARMMSNTIAAVVHNTKASEERWTALSDSLRALSSVLAVGPGRQVLLDSIVEKIMEVVKVDAASLFLVDDSGERLVIQAASGYQRDLVSAEPRPSYAWGEGVTGRIASTNQPFHADSLHELRTRGGGKRGKYDHLQGGIQPESFYGMPLYVEAEERLIGVLKVESRTPRPFRDEDVLLITMMGNVIASVMYNAQMAAEASESRLGQFSEDLRALTSVLAVGPGRQVLMDNIVERIMEVVKVDAASLFLVDDSGERLVIQAASGYQRDLVNADPKPSYAWGEGVTGRIAATNQPFHADSLQQLRTRGGGKRGKFDHLQDDNQPESFYGMPLNVEAEERPIGVLKVESLATRPFTDEDVLLITMMGSIIAAVVYNAQISEDELASLSEDIRRLSDVLTPGGQSAQEWFQKIVDTISRMFATDAASLYLVDETNKRLVISAASGYQRPLVKADAFYEWGEGVTGRIAQTGLPVRADTLQSLRDQGTARRGKYDDLQGGNQPDSFYGAPLRVPGEADSIGVLKFESLQEAFFTDGNRLLIDMMANVIATVIHNTRQSEKRIGSILQQMGLLCEPSEAASAVLHEYASEKDAGLVNQLARALAEDLGEQPHRVSEEAERIFDARKPLGTDVRPDLYARIASWAGHLGHDRVQWECQLYGDIVRSNPGRYAQWSQVSAAAAPWLALKDSYTDTDTFVEHAARLAHRIARLVGTPYTVSGADATSTWFMAALDTEAIFGEQVKYVLLLLQCQGELDEASQLRLEALATRDDEHPFPVLLVVTWGRPEPPERVRSLRDLLRPSSVDVAFASIEDILNLTEAGNPTDFLRRLVLRQATIASPFITMGAVPESMFYGRAQEVRALTSNPAGHDFAVIGNRRIGKTSLLRRVLSRLEPRSDICAYEVNCIAVQDSTSDFYARFQDQTGVTLHDSTPRGFEKAMRTIHSGGRTPVLLIDEVDRLLVLDQMEGEPLAKTWRALSQERICRFIFFGCARLAQQMTDARSDMLNFAETLRLGYLSREVSHRVLTEPLLKLGVSLENEAAIAHEVHRVTAGHPNLVQYMGKLLIDAANARGERRILCEDVAEVIASDDFGRRYQNVIWGDAGPLEKLITLVAPAGSFTRTTLCDALQEVGVAFAADRPGSEPGGPATKGALVLLKQVQLEESLKMLALYSVVEESVGTYRMVPSSFREILGQRREAVASDVRALVEELSLGVS